MLVTPTSDKPRVILGLMTFGPPGTEDKGARITSLDEYKKCLECKSFLVLSSLPGGVLCLHT